MKRILLLFALVPLVASCTGLGVFKDPDTGGAVITTDTAPEDRLVGDAIGTTVGAVTSNSGLGVLAGVLGGWLFGRRRKKAAESPEA